MLQFTCKVLTIKYIQRFLMLLSEKKGYMVTAVTVTVFRDSIQKESVPAKARPQRYYFYLQLKILLSSECTSLFLEQVGDELMETATPSEEFVASALRY
jgi:hypothetical protein